MTPEKIQEVIDYLLKTGELLATKGFEIAYRQVWVEGVIYSVIFGVLLILGIIGIVHAWRVGWKPENTEEEKYFFELLVSIFIFVIGIVALPSKIMMLLNPSWYAIKMLLNLL